MKNVQMPEGFFLDVLRLLYTIDQYEAAPEITQQCDNIRNQINTKLEKLHRRELYTQSKTADTPEAREAARKAYLNAINMPDDWRY